MIVGVLLDGPRRFAELGHAIPQITDGMLSSRLAELKAAGLVDREIIEGPPLATVYMLTDKGEALRPALLALADWARAHMVGATSGVTQRGNGKRMQISPSSGSGRTTRG